MNAPRTLLVVSLSALAGCASIRGADQPTAKAHLGFATQYWFRGTPLSEELVAQGDATITAPLKNGDSVSFTTWGNYQLSNSAGDAVFPDRNGGDFSEIDLTGKYTTKIEDATVVAGVISYDFPNAVGVSTHELFAGATFGGDPLSQTVTLYYDFDQADGFYLTYGLGRAWTLDDRFTASVSGLIGFMSDDQAAFYYGTKQAGLSDASVTGELDYKFDEFTNIYARAQAITVPDGDLRDAEDARGFQTSAVVFTFGVGWSL